MTDLVQKTNTLGPGWGTTALDLSARFWFAVTFIGQWLFVAYISVYYGSHFLDGGVAGFANTRLPNGYIEGDTLGNLAIVTHVLLAALIIAAGQLQLMPAVRARAPMLHRWSGRFYMVGSVLATQAGMYLILFRERILGSDIQDVAVIFGGVLVFVFAFQAYRHARRRRIAAHRRWALRLFMAVSAVWFLRQMVFGWYLLTGGIGIDDATFSGPFPIFANFAQYLLPLAMLELYFWAQRPQNETYRGRVAVLLMGMTGLMCVGLYAVASGLWIPKMLASVY